MKLSINRQVLLEELSNAAKLIDGKGFNPAMFGIFMEASLDKLIIISTNGQTSFKTELNNENSDLEIKQPGRILIKPRYILDTLRKLESQFVALDSFEQSELEIKTEKSSLRIGILDPEDFPLIGFVEKGIEIAMNPVDFKQTIMETINSINIYNKKIVLTGMNLKMQDNKISFATTDLYRVSLKEIAIENNENEVDIIIPLKTLNELNRLMEGIKKFKIIIFEGYATFKLDNRLLQSILIDGKYPNVQSAFPSVFEVSLELKTKTILKVLSRFELPHDTNQTPIINMAIENNEILLKTNTDSVKYEEVFNDFKQEGATPIKISFNTKFLLEALRSFDTSSITLKFINSSKPIFISSAESNQLKQVVLPTFME